MLPPTHRFAGSACHHAATDAHGRASIRTPMPWGGAQAAAAATICTPMPWGGTQAAAAATGRQCTSEVAPPGLCMRVRWGARPCWVCAYTRVLLYECRLPTHEGFLPHCVQTACTYTWVAERLQRRPCDSVCAVPWYGSRQACRSLGVAGRLQRQRCESWAPTARRRRRSLWQPCCTRCWG